jgi:hemerythrin
MLRKRPKFRRVITAGFIAALSDAVPLHDIGKVGIRDDILLKSAALSREEFVTMKSHVLIGRDIIQDIIARFRLDSAFLVVSKNICYYHHERYDGSGYPEGLRGNDIPLEARIFAICDVYDALRAKRPYKPGMTHEEAVETIIPERGRHFDPEVVDAFLECGDRFHEIFEAYRLFDSTYGRLMNTRSKDALKIAWSEDLSVGDGMIDSQHVEFIDRVNSLFAAILAGEGRREALREITFLHDYAVRHFRMEEGIMELHHFPEIERHKREHEEFLRTLSTIRKDVKSADDISSELVVTVNAKVVNWLVNHVIRSDKTLGEYVRAQSRAEG